MVVLQPFISLGFEAGDSLKILLLPYNLDGREQGKSFGEQVGEVDQTRPVPGVAASDQNLGPVILDVIFDGGQSLDGFKRHDERLRLGRGAPIGSWFPQLDEGKEENDDDEGGEGRFVIHEEHDDDADNGAEERDPFVVVVEGGPPPGGVGDVGVEDGEVDQGVSSDEEVGQ